LEGLFVDRGWLPYENKDLKIHRQDAGKEVVVEGVVFKSEGKSHTGKQNDEVNKLRIDLEEFIKKTDLSNRD